MEELSPLIDKPTFKERLINVGQQVLDLIGELSRQDFSTPAEGPLRSQAAPLKYVSPKVPDSVPQNWTDPEL